jgi:hypothetical protein
VPRIQADPQVRPLRARQLSRLPRTASEDGQVVALGDSTQVVHGDRVTSQTPFRQRLVLAVVPRLVWALLWLVGRTWRFEIIAEEGATPLPFGEGAGARDLLLLAPVRAALHVLLPPHPRHHHRQPELRRRAHRAHPRALRLPDRARLQLARRARRPARPQAVIEAAAPPSSPPTARAAPSIAPRWAPSSSRTSPARASAHFILQPQRAWTMQFLGSLPGAHAVYAHRSQLGALDPRSQPTSPRASSKQKREELNAAIERARLQRPRHFGNLPMRS